MPDFESGCLTIIIISIHPLGQFGQEPETSQATGRALECCILDKFLGVVCHAFPLPDNKHSQKNESCVRLKISEFTALNISTSSVIKDIWKA